MFIEEREKRGRPGREGGREVYLLVEIPIMRFLGRYCTGERRRRRMGEEEARTLYVPACCVCACVRMCVACVRACVRFIFLYLPSFSCGMILPTTRKGVSTYVRA